MSATLLPNTRVIHRAYTEYGFGLVRYVEEDTFGDARLQVAFDHLDNLENVTPEQNWPFKRGTTLYSASIRQTTHSSNHLHPNWWKGIQLHTNWRSRNLFRRRVFFILSFFSDLWDLSV